MLTIIFKLIHIYIYRKKDVAAMNARKKTRVTREMSGRNAPRNVHAFSFYMRILHSTLG